jgi:hypothetical protein
MCASARFANRIRQACVTYALGWPLARPLAAIADRTNSYLAGPTGYGSAIPKWLIGVLGPRSAYGRPRSIAGLIGLNVRFFTLCTFLLELAAAACLYDVLGWPSARLLPGCAD